MPKSISTVADRSSGALACPSCGGTTFKPKRSKAKFIFGLLAPRSRVRCVTCGKTYKRG